VHECESVFTPAKHKVPVNSSSGQLFMWIFLWQVDCVLVTVWQVDFAYFTVCGWFLNDTKWRHRIINALMSWRYALLSKLDYSNVVLVELQNSMIRMLQQVRYALPHLVLQLWTYDHSSGSLQKLHWLSLRSRILYKCFTLIYAVHNRKAPVTGNPVYIVNWSILLPCLSVLASSASNYTAPRLWTKFNECCCSYASSASYNNSRMNGELRLILLLLHNFKKLCSL